jgi:hypothetical protein
LKIKWCLTTDEIDLGEADWVTNTGSQRCYLSNKDGFSILISPGITLPWFGDLRARAQIGYGELYICKKE